MSLQRPVEVRRGPERREAAHVPALDGIRILCVDDDPLALGLEKRLVFQEGGEVATAADGAQVLQALKHFQPDVILLDVMLPDTDGYQLCADLAADPRVMGVPVIFVTALEGQEDRARAFAVGAADFIAKPVSRAVLISKIRKLMEARGRLTGGPEAPIESHITGFASRFEEFKLRILANLGPQTPSSQALGRIRPTQIYTVYQDAGRPAREAAMAISEFLGLPYMFLLNPDDVQVGVLALPFCRRHQVVPVQEPGGGTAFVLSNPFDAELLEALDRVSSGGARLKVTEPQNLNYLLDPKESGEAEVESGTQAAAAGQRVTFGSSEAVSIAELQKKPVIYIADKVLQAAVAQRASDIHIEPKEQETLVRFRVDGDMQPMFSFKTNTGVRLISRLKILGGLDISERRRPQDGAFLADVDGRLFNIRLATTSTIHGESMIIRLLEPNAAPKPLTDLGMTPTQQETLESLARRKQGLILMVGPTGSGKTTTIYSLLARIDCGRRSLITIEDPVEYRIPNANQQQVNEKGGVTFEALLKSSVRQDPDILYIGEVRDPFSAKIAVDFSSTGHLTVATLHTVNATSALMRLERLGLNRAAIGDSVAAIVAQRLIKKLCPHCREFIPLSPEESSRLASFPGDRVRQSAHPKGCPRCGGTGYRGREAVYEILVFDTELLRRVREGLPPDQIRAYAASRGDYLMVNHALEKVREGSIALQDAFRQVLADVEGDAGPAAAAERPEPIKEPRAEGRGSVLVVEDDGPTRLLVTSYLSAAGYACTEAKDGLDALMQMMRAPHDLVLMDMRMPDLDGDRVLEIMREKGIETPVLFLTGEDFEASEIRALERGAVDYLRKPVSRPLLLARVSRAMKKD